MPTLEKFTITLDDDGEEVTEEMEQAAIAQKSVQTSAPERSAITPPSTAKKPKKKPTSKKKANASNIASFFAPRKTAPVKSKAPSNPSSDSAAATSKADPTAHSAKQTPKEKPKTSTKASVGKSTEKTSKDNARPKATSGMKRKTPTHDQLMEIVVGSAVKDHAMPNKQIKFEHPYNSDLSSPLPIRVLRNPGIVRGWKNAKSSMLTPSPMANGSLSKTNGSSEEESNVNVKLFDKLEMSVESSSKQINQVSFVTATEKSVEAAPEIKTDEAHSSTATEHNEKAQNSEAEIIELESSTKATEDNGQAENAGEEADDAQAATDTESNNDAEKPDVEIIELESTTKGEAEAEKPKAETDKVEATKTTEINAEAEKAVVDFDRVKSTTTTEGNETEQPTVETDKMESIMATECEGDAEEPDIEVMKMECTAASQGNGEAEKAGVETVKMQSTTAMECNNKAEEPEVEITEVKYATATERNAETEKPEVEIVKLQSATATKCNGSTFPNGSIKAQPKPPAVGIPKEIMSVIEKHDGMRSRYRRRAEELVNKARDGLEEENFELPKPSELPPGVKLKTDASPPTEDQFPDSAVPSLAVIIQGSRLPLSSLAERAIELLQESCKEAKFTTEAVTAKIKVLAARESYVGNVTGQSTTTNVFEDTNPERMWRWELISLDLLPEKIISKVKRARTSRRKLRTHHKAIAKLLSSLDEADKLLRNNESTKERRDISLAKISSAEEKVLKYEREAEKNRLAEEAKKKKEQVRMQKEREKQKEKAQKQKEKEQAEESKRKEKALRQAEKERKKQEAAKVREELKRKKEEEREEEKKKVRLEMEEEAKKKEEKVKKQQSMMMSFFSAPSAKPTSSGQEPEPDTAEKPVDTRVFDADKFRSLINSSDGHAGDAPLFQKLSKSALASRSRRTKKVPVTVFVTMVSENPFTEQPYDEQKEILVPNRYKFLRFHEDCRPPYHGTWSKPRSKVVTGRNPLGKDTAYLDYDVDSEAEWEEGDDDPGEDCEDDAADDEEDNLEDEEGDTRVYNFQDGWLTHDDDLGRDDEEIDEDTLALRKKRLEAGNSTDKRGNDVNSELSTICVIAPAMGGLPQAVRDDADDSACAECIEGVAAKEALKFLALHEGMVCSPDLEICLDAFPPDLIDENTSSPADLSANSNGTGKGSAGGSKGKSSTGPQEMSKDDLKTFVEFVHKCTLPSKDKVVEQLRTVHKNVTSSRAQATRKLDSVAAKKRHPDGGVVWEVKREIIEELGLEKLTPVAVSQAEPEEKAAKSQKGAKSNQVKKTPPKGKSTDTKANSGDGKKRKRGTPTVSKASANLFAAFLKKRKVPESK